MGTAIAASSSLSPPRLSVKLSEAARWTSAAQDRLSGLSTRQRVFAATGLAGTILAFSAMSTGPQTTGYLGVFVFSALANAVLFLPSARGAIMLAAAMVLNPLAVAILAGAGGAIGELTGYALGRSSRHVLGPAKVPAWLSTRTERHIGGTILAASIIPNPFVDAVGIVAGRLRYPVPLFLAYSIVGKVAQSIVLVYLALWNLSLFGSWLNLGL